MKAILQGESGEALGFRARASKLWAGLESALAAMELGSTDLLERRLERLEDQVARLTEARGPRDGGSFTTEEER